MNTQYRKNLKAVLEASKAYCDESIDSLKWELGTYDLSVDTNTNTAHIKTLPSGTIQTTVAKVEGVGYKVNQILGTSISTNTSAGITFTNNNNGSWTLNGIAEANITFYISNEFSNLANHKILILLKKTATSGVRLMLMPTFVGTDTSAIVESSSNAIKFSFYIANGTDLTTPITVYPNIFDLTADFGSGNEPTSVSDCATAYLQRGINIYEYTPQQSSIKNNAFTSVKVEGANIAPLNNQEYEKTFTNQYGVGVIPFTNTINIENGKTYSYSIKIKGNGTSRFNKIAIATNSSNNILESVYTPYIQASTTYTTLTFTFTATSDNVGYGIWLQTVDANSTFTFKEFILNYGSTALDYVPYIQPTTIPIDLTTIKDSNNVSLFPSGKLMGNSSVADFITPYNQESRWNEKTYASSDVTNVADIFTYTNIKYYQIPKPQDYKYKGTPTSTNYINSKFEKNTATSDWDDATKIGKIFAGASYDWFWVGFPIGTTLAQAQSAINGLIIQYERATYLTSNTDLTSLTRINAQSNGTIILNNTDNVDMPNTVDYLIEEVKA